MLIPARRQVLLAGLLVAASLVVPVVPTGLALWLGITALALVVAATDAVRALRLPPPAARRLVPGSLPLGVAHDIAIRLANVTRRAVTVEVHDHYPAGVEVQGQPQTVSVPAGGWVEVRYRLRPVRRGEIAFAQVEARIASPLGLWQVRRRLGEGSTARVYPNFAELTRVALLATDHRLAQIGILQRRRRGEGLDFHQLRDYREGDVPRQIDWKATARTHRLISREYQDERDQQVLLLIDCGRRMAAHDGELSHFDHVLNAALLLAYVGLRQGDAVGVLTVSGAARWIAPRKGRSAINRILSHLYDLQPTLATTDFYAAAVELIRRVRKRALVVILSNLRDEDEETLAPALRALRSRHLVLFASLREAVLSRALVSRVDTFDQALTHAAAAEYLQSRELVLRRLESAGAVCVDVEPDRLPTALVNRYLDIKRSSRL